jgi:thioredoxin reductase
LTEKAKVGKNVVIIGGNRIGMDLAYTIGKKNLAKSITIIEPQIVSEIGYDMEIMNQVVMTMVLLPKLGVQVLTGTRIEEITDKGVTVVDPEGKKRKIEADTVVISAGYEADKTLEEALRGKVKLVYAVGDCVKARNRVRDAVHEGAYRARQI